MSTPLKIGIGGLSFAAIAGTGIVIWSNAEPHGRTLAESKDTENLDKFGGLFKHHMVSATNADNDAWWNWSFEHRWKNSETKDSEFSGVSSFSDLKSKCKDEYNKETKTIESKDQNVWKYCSLEGKKPATVKDSGDGTLGKSGESYLVSTKDADNNRFWDIQEQAFFGEDGLGSKAESDIFKGLYKDKNGTLRGKCEEVYGKQESGLDKEKKDVFAFCSLNPKKST